MGHNQKTTALLVQGARVKLGDKNGALVGPSGKGKVLVKFDGESRARSVSLIKLERA